MDIPSPSESDISDSDASDGSAHKAPASASKVSILQLALRSPTSLLSFPSASERPAIVADQTDIVVASIATPPLSSSLQLVKRSSSDLLPAAQPTKQRRWLNGSHNGADRSEVQNQALCAIMREKRAVTKHGRIVDEVRRQAQGLIESLQHSGAIIAKSLRLKIVNRWGSNQIASLPHVVLVHNRRGDGGVAIRRRFTSSALCNIASAPEPCVHAVARQFRVQSRDVRWARQSMAHVLMQLQSYFFGMISLTAMLVNLLSDACNQYRLDVAEAKSTKVSIRQIRFDETSQEVFVPLESSLSNYWSQVTQWHVGVQTRDYLMTAIIEGPDYLLERPIYVDSCIPVIWLKGTKASYLDGMLRTHENVKSNVEFENRCRLEADFDIPIFVSDSASSNSKYIHHHCQTECPESYPIVKSCSSHDQAIVENSIVSSFDIDFTASLYCCCKFLEQQQHWQRVLQCTHDLVAARFAEMDTGFNFIDLHELSDYAISNWSLFQRWTNTTSTIKMSKNIAGSSSHTEITERWAELLATVRVTSCGRYVPFAGQGSLHKIGDAPKTQILKSSIVLQNAGLQRKPRPPAKNKWTLLAPVVDVFVIAWCLGLTSIMGDGPHSAWRSYSSNRSVWHVVSGVYCKRCKEFIVPENLWLLLILALILEPSRFLTCWFLQHNRRYRGMGHPGVHDLVYPSFSPLLIVRQYISSLLRGKARRLALITSRAGVASLPEWAAKHPSLARQLRKCARTFSAWVYYKHCRIYWKPPFTLFSLSDLRVPEYERQRICDTFYVAQACCLVWGFARQVRTNVSSASLMGSTWIRILFRLSCILRLGVCDVECRHARNRRWLRKGMSFAHFAAAYTIDEFKKIWAETLVVLLRIKRWVTDVASTSTSTRSRDQGRIDKWAMTADELSSTVRRGRSPLECFKWSRFRHMRAHGIAVRVCEWHAPLRVEFDRLDDQGPWIRESERSYIQARANREILRAQSTLVAQPCRSSVGESSGDSSIVNRRSSHPAFACATGFVPPSDRCDEFLAASGFTPPVECLGSTLGKPRGITRGPRAYESSRHAYNVNHSNIPTSMH